jgi:hypothetical protein
MFDIKLKKRKRKWKKQFKKKIESVQKRKDRFTITCWNNAEPSGQKSSSGRKIQTQSQGWNFRKAARYFDEIALLLDLQVFRQFPKQKALDSD